MRIGSLQLASPLVLAPMAGYCDLAFRLTARQVPATPDCGGGSAVGLAYTELLCSEAVRRHSRPTLWRAASCEADRPLGVQLYGADPAALADAARWAADHGAALIDLNMGCPVDRVTRTRGGAALLCEPDLAVRLARAVVGAVTLPVTAKLRLGWDDQHLVAPWLAVALADAGVAGITIHGRTAGQLFGGTVRLDGIAAVVQAVKHRHPHVPVIGNGDIRSPQDARRMLDRTGCDGLMIGRGALGRPWVFRDVLHDLRTGRPAPPLDRPTRIALILDHVEAVRRIRADQGDPRAQDAALRMIRQRISGYSAGLQPWPHLRRDVRRVASLEALRAYLTAPPPEAPAPPAPPAPSRPSESAGPYRSPRDLAPPAAPCRIRTNPSGR